MVPLCEAPWEKEERRLLEKHLRLNGVRWRESQGTFLAPSTVWVEEEHLPLAREALRHSRSQFARLVERRKRSLRLPRSLREYLHWLKERKTGLLACLLFGSGIGLSIALLVAFLRAYVM